MIAPVGAAPAEPTRDEYRHGLDTPVTPAPYGRTVYVAGEIVAGEIVADTISGHDHRRHDRAEIVSNPLAGAGGDLGGAGHPTLAPPTLPPPTLPPVEAELAAAKTALAKEKESSTLLKQRTLKRIKGLQTEQAAALQALQTELDARSRELEEARAEAESSW